ncbi:MAG: hypothetical protein JJU29_18480 [Verrucomicrobia bacterium]|nr:hypothetical protein [Verrucomicrobiota bacterium]MCH8512328.1 hypothetical protein [Kiritimatiellia bacterium]
MRTFLVFALAVLLSGLGSLVNAQGWTTEHALVEGQVEIPNVQANSSWFVVSLLIAFDEPTTGEIKVYRERDGVRHTLGLCVFEDAVSVVWAPEAKFSFRKGETLVVESSMQTGVFQLIRRAD